MSLRNADYTDRELLHIVDDCTNEEGYAHTLEIAEKIFGDPEPSKQDRHYVGSRMAWMVRYAFCARHPDEPGLYRLTTEGRNLMGGKLTKGVQTQLDKMGDADRVLVLREAAKTAFAATGPSQDFFRREYTYHYENRARARSNGRRR